MASSNEGVPPNYASLPSTFKTLLWREAADEKWCAEEEFDGKEEQGEGATKADTEKIGTHSRALLSALGSA